MKSKRLRVASVFIVLVALCATARPVPGARPVLSANLATPGEKAAAEKVFHTIDDALQNWNGNVPRDQLVSLQQCLSRQTTILLVWPHVNGKQVRVTYERHSLSLATMKKIIAEKAANNDHLGVVHESKESSQFFDWLSWDYSRTEGKAGQPVRTAIGEWKWHGAYQYASVSHPSLVNRIKLVKEDGAWKLKEIQIAKMSFLGD